MGYFYFMLNRIHKYAGILIVVIFLLTGQYMHLCHDHSANTPDLPRALFRTGNLYILLFGLINLSLGIYQTQLESTKARLFQKLGTITILIASVLCVYSFFAELPSTKIERPISRLSLYLVFGGVISHYLASSVSK